MEYCGGGIALSGLFLTELSWLQSPSLSNLLESLLCVLGTGARTATRTLPELFSHLLYEKRDVFCEMIMTARGIIPEPLVCVAVFHPSVYQIV